MQNKKIKPMTQDINLPATSQKPSIIYSLMALIFIGGSFILINAITTPATEEIANLPTIKIPGRIEGVGTHFEINDSEYLNLSLDSSESIKITFESIPEMITMMIEPVSFTSSTQIKISGFTPFTTYYKYQDDYHNLAEFTTDENGSYTYTQDLSKTHFIFIQPRKSTKFIKDDATGGDCYLIGMWNIKTKTCSLTTDVYETIQIDSDNITLDGRNYIILGNNTGFGIYIIGRNNITIKNLNIKKFSYGAFLHSSVNSAITGNTILENWHGILLESYSNNNLLANNIISDNRYGIWLSSFSNSNIIKENIINLSGWIGIYLMQSGNNNLTENTISNNFYGLTISFPYATNNKTYNNNFIGSICKQVVISYASSGNIFNIDSGGNYWDNFDTPAEGCSDLNNDNFCDLPYSFPGGQDNLPWIKQDEWKSQPVAIDIKPGGYPNSINCQNPKDIIPVAILTTEIFDAVTVDVDTIRFGPNGAQEIHRDRDGKAQRHIEDVDKDGDLDLVLHFKFSDTGIKCGDIEATLTGKTQKGFNIIGSDSIRTIQ